MTQHSTHQNYLGPFITMVLLFFIVGFLTVVNQQFQIPIKEAFLNNAGNIKNTLTTLITFSWFLAYPCTGWIGSKWVQNYGYKSTLVRALSLLTLGLLIFVFSAWSYGKIGDLNISDVSVSWSFVIFLLGSFVAGAAVTVLQVVLNPYIIASDVKGTSAEMRINIGGSSNSIGTTLAPFFVTGIIFAQTSMENVKVDDIILPFIILAAVMLLTAFIVSKLHLPNISKTEVKEGEVLAESIWSFRHLTLGVIAIFVYVGAEVAIGSNINLYAQEVPEYASLGATMASLYWGGMLVGRLVGSVLKTTARIQLLITSMVSIVLVLLAMYLNNPWFLVAVGLFHSVMWGMIFSLAISGLGKYTSKGSGVLMIGVLGGGLIPLFQGMFADALGAWQYTFWIVIACEIYMLYYALVGYKPNKVVK